jgi:hypothetical protein
MSTAGRLMLLHVLQVIPAREVALRVHVTEMAVSHWRSGFCVPRLATRALLEAHCRIPAMLWDVKRQSQRRRVF